MISSSRYNDYFEIFGKLRKNSANNYYAYLRRAYFNVSSKNSKSDTDTQKLSTQKVITKDLLSRRVSVRKKAKSIKSYDEAILIVLNAKRFKRDNYTVKEKLLNALKGLPSSNDADKLTSLLNQSKNIIVFDVVSFELFELNLSDSITCLNSKEVKSLLFLNPINVLGYVKNKFRKADNNYWAGRKFISIYEKIFRNTNIKNAIFLTSNGLDIEMLRCYLLNNDNTNAVYEVMHGIPSEIVQAFFSDLAGYSDKMKFITQLPSINDYILHDKQDHVESDLSINSYFTSYFGSNNEGFDKFKEYFRQKLKDFNLSIDLLEGRQIYLIIGGRTHDIDYIESDSFAIEKHTIEQVIESDKKSVVLYSPHPFYNSDIFTSLPFFKNKGITCVPDTVFCLLIATKAFGIVSSTLFEAVYLDIKTYTPMLPSDKLFSEGMLEILKNSIDIENYNYKEFIEKNAQSTNVFATAIERQEKLYTWRD